MSVVYLAEFYCLFLVNYFSISAKYEMEESVDNTTLKDDSKLSTFYCPSTIQLQKVLKSSAENVLDKVTSETFIHIYKECYQVFEKKDDIEKPSLRGSSVEARKYRQQFNDIVTQEVCEAIDETLTTMDSKMKYLEKLKMEQTDESVVWRPPGDAYKHMVPFDSVSKLEEKKELENLIQKEREAIDLLKGRLMQKRLKANNLYDILMSSLKKIENSVTKDVAEKAE